MMFLLEIQQLDNYKRVLYHSVRVMDRHEIKQMEQIYQEFCEALNGKQDPEVNE